MGLGAFSTSGVGGGACSAGEAADSFAARFDISVVDADVMIGATSDVGSSLAVPASVASGSVSGLGSASGVEVMATGFSSGVSISCSFSIGVLCAS